MTVQEFLAADDLDDLAEIRARLPEPAHLDGRSIEAVLGGWSDLQAIANLLMYPDMLPVEHRGAALVRALASTAHSYLQLAAAVGVGKLSADALAPDWRAQVVEALLDVIAGDAGPIAMRASASLAGIAARHEAVELVVLLGHPVAAVRHNLRLSLLELIGLHGMRRLLGDRAGVSELDIHRATQAFASDGFDIDSYPQGPAALMQLGYIPNLSEWVAG